MSDGGFGYGSFNEDPNELMKNLEERAGMIEEAAPYPEPRRAQKIGPNEPCPCGSGKKYKKCCGRRG